MSQNQRPFVHVGTNKETVIAAQNAIMEILNSDCEQHTKREALATLTHICEVKNTHITNCNFTA